MDDSVVEMVQRGTASFAFMTQESIKVAEEDHKRVIPNPLSTPPTVAKKLEEEKPMDEEEDTIPC